MKHIALALIANSNTIALLGSREKDSARLVFAKSADAPGDMNALMREALFKNAVLVKTEKTETATSQIFLKYDSLKLDV